MLSIKFRFNKLKNLINNHSHKTSQFAKLGIINRLLHTGKTFLQKSTFTYKKQPQNWVCRPSKKKHFIWFLIEQFEIWVFKHRKHWLFTYSAMDNCPWPWLFLWTNHKASLLKATKKLVKLQFHPEAYSKPKLRTDFLTVQFNSTYAPLFSDQIKLGRCWFACETQCHASANLANYVRTGALQRASSLLQLRYWKSNEKGEAN